MKNLIQSGDEAGMRALAGQHPTFMASVPHDFFWEAMKAHPLASDEDLAKLLGVLVDLGHSAFAKGTRALHLAIKQHQLCCAGVLLDAQAPLSNDDRDAWMVAVLADPTQFDLPRAWKWRGSNVFEGWHQTLLAAGVLFGTDPALLADHFARMEDEHRADGVCSHMIRWLSFHVVELAEGRVSRLAPTLQSVGWWVDAVGREKAEPFWQQVALDHWPDVRAVKALMDQHVLNRQTLVREAAPRPRL